MWQRLPGTSGRSCTPISSTNKTDRHDIAEILLKVELNTVTETISVIINTYNIKWPHNDGISDDDDIGFVLHQHAELDFDSPHEEMDT